MGLVSKEISRAELKPGDHIYSWRTGYIFAHHGIYVGEGIVIHFRNATGTGSGTPIDSFIPSSSASSATGNRCPRCGYHSELGGVISSCVDCFVAGDDLCLFEYDVSRSYFLKRLRGGTCSIASSDSAEDVLHRAYYLLKNGFGAYGLFRKNCEDFAIYCKTGRILIRDDSGNRAGRTMVLSSITCMALGLAGLPLVALPFVALPFSIYNGRLANEIALVKAEKIPVEILVSRCLSR